MPVEMRLLSFTLIPLLLSLNSTVLHGDAIITLEVTADQLSMPKKIGTVTQECSVSINRPRTGDLITLYVREDRVRREQGDVTLILRQDLKKLYLIYPTTQSYNEITLPLDVHAYTSEFAELIGPELFHYKVQDLAPPKDMGVHQWSGKKYSVTVVNGVRNNYRVSYVLSGIEQVFSAPVIALQKAINTLRFGANDWLDLLPLTEGMVIFWEEAQLGPSSEAIYREEVVDIKNVDVPAEMYQPGPGLERIEYDPSCVELR